MINKDIAKTLGISEFAAMVMFCRAKRKLQKIMNRSGFGCIF